MSNDNTKLNIEFVSYPVSLVEDDIDMLVDFIVLLAQEGFNSNNKNENVSER